MDSCSRWAIGCGWRHLRQSVVIHPAAHYNIQKRDLTSSLWHRVAMTTIKYAAFVIFLIIVFLLIWILRDGFSVRGGRIGQVQPPAWSSGVSLLESTEHLHA